jgi:hypothetical protein
VSTSQHSECCERDDAQLLAHSAAGINAFAFSRGGEGEREDGPGDDSGEDDSGVEKQMLLNRVTGRTGLEGGETWFGMREELGGVGIACCGACEGAAGAAEEST